MQWGEVKMFKEIDISLLEEKREEFINWSDEDYKKYFGVPREYIENNLDQVHIKNYKMCLWKKLIYETLENHQKKEFLVVYGDDGSNGKRLLTEEECNSLLFKDMIKEKYLKEEKHKLHKAKELFKKTFKKSVKKNKDIISIPKAWKKLGCTTFEEYTKKVQEINYKNGFYHSWDKKPYGKKEEDFKEGEIKMDPINNEEKESELNKDPQLENGYTRIANELLEALMNAGASGIITAREYALILYIIRYTYGFHKEDGYFHNKVISEEFKWSKFQTSNFIKSLTKKNILIKDGDLFKLNKHYNEWNVNEIINSNKKLTKSLTKVNEMINSVNDIVNNVNEIVNSNDSQDESESNVADLPKISIKKSYKDINKDTSASPFKKTNPLKNIKFENNVLSIDDPAMNYLIEKYGITKDEVILKMNQAEAYLLSHPEKHYKNISAFLINWFNFENRVRNKNLSTTKHMKPHKFTNKEIIIEGVDL